MLILKRKILESFLIEVKYHKDLFAELSSWNLIKIEKKGTFHSDVRILSHCHEVEPSIADMRAPIVLNIWKLQTE